MLLFWEDFLLYWLWLYLWYLVGIVFSLRFLGHPAPTPAMTTTGAKLAVDVEFRAEHLEGAIREAVGLLETHNTTRARLVILFRKTLGETKE
jgi:hypothetical protein